jgi:hypothetical protein
MCVVSAIGLINYIVIKIVFLSFQVSSHIIPISVERIQRFDYLLLEHYWLPLSAAICTSMYHTFHNLSSSYWH